MMFETFRVRRLMIVNAPVMALYSVGKTTGIVIDAGNSLTSAVPVKDGAPISQAIMKMNCAGQTLTDYA